ncbi:hypothetical protein ScPMuIL_014458 [Solemya velum]
MVQCVSEGHEIVALANLKPLDIDELDSYMYQTVGHQAIDLYAEAMDLPLYRRTIKGSSKSIGHSYEPTENDEVEDLYMLLKEVKEKQNVEAVSVGAILSDYQRVRVENVCGRLGLTALSYLWRREQEELLREMIDCGVDAIVIKTATLGLEPDKHLQKTLNELYTHLLKMNELYQLNVCGEGGEYETFTLDCPLFNKRIVLDEVEQVLHSDDAFAPVGYLNLKVAHLEAKNMDLSINWRDRLKDLPLTRSSALHQDLFGEEERSLFGEEARIPYLIELSVHTKVDKLWVSGLCAPRQPGMSLAESTVRVMETLKAVVEGQGRGLKCLVLVCLYVQNMDDFAAINSIYKQYFSLNPPARVCVEASLPQNVCLQIDCYGYGMEETRKTMHVQGISHWAPANIGPYSQSVKISNTVYVAGQIALCPATMEIIQGGILPESRLSLRHVKRVCAAMLTGCGLSHVVSCICYVTNSNYIKTAAAEWTRARLQNNVSVAVRTERCIVTFVVIPHLPRQALIEWQVYASMEEEVQGLYFLSLQQKLILIISKCIDDISVQGSDILSLEDVDLPINKAVKLLLGCYEKVLHRTENKWADVPIIRIFYSHVWCDHARLLQEFKTNLAEKAKSLALLVRCLWFQFVN